MVCPECNKFVSQFDEQCQHCKMPLKGNPVKNYTRKSDEIIAKAEARAGDVLSQIQGGFKEKSASRDCHAPSASAAGVKGFYEKSVGQAHSSDTRHEDTLRPSKEIVGEAVDILAIKEKIEFQQQSNIDNMKHYVFTNPHVMNNDEWAAKAQKTYFAFEWENADVNAGARQLSDKEIESCKGKYYFAIIMQGGYVNFCYAVASAFVESGQSLFNFELLQRVIAVYKQNKGQLSSFDLVDIVRQTDRTLDVIGADASKIIFECIAHELGHICYGHIHGPGYAHRTSGENIGQEHDADSFAYAVIYASPSKKELWLGLIQFMVVRAAQEAYYGRHEATTHPLDIDRLRTAIVRFPDLAKQYGIDEKWAENVVSKIYGWLR